MPPNTENEILLTPGGSNRSSTANSPASMCAKTSLPRKDSFQFLADLDLEQPSFDDEQVDEDYNAFTNSLKEVSQRFDSLLQMAENKTGDFSPVLDACHLSLRTRMPHVLEQTSQLIESIQESKEESIKMVAKMRSSLALVRAAQYLDIIDIAMEDPPRKRLDGQLANMLESSEMKELALEFQTKPSFRVSPWVTSLLAFEIPAGLPARRTLTTDVFLPISVEVEPVFEFRAEDLDGERNVLHSYRACSVEIEKFRHDAREFCAGAGTIGVCTLKLRISPLNDDDADNLRVWGYDEDVPKLCITEARV